MHASRLRVWLDDARGERVVDLPMPTGMECSRIRSGDVVGSPVPELLVGCWGSGRAFGFVVRYDAASGGFTKRPVGLTGRFTVVLPFLQTRCSELTLSAVARYGRTQRAVALSCFGGFGEGAFVFRMSSPTAQLVDSITSEFHASSYERGCGRELASGDFDGDGRGDVAMSCGNTEVRPSVDEYRSQHTEVVVTFGARGMRGSRLRDVLVGSPGRDELNAGRSEDVVRGLAGDDAIHAVDGREDVIDCGQGRDRAAVDRFDRVRNCEIVRRSS